MNSIDWMARLLGTLKSTDYRTFDHYDLWGRPLGRFLRSNKAILKPFVGLAYLADVWFPRFVRIGLSPSLQMETLPGLLSAMVTYMRATGDRTYESDRQRLLNELLSRIAPSTHGAGLGHPFDWQTGSVIPSYTPLVPLTSSAARLLLARQSAGEGMEEERSFLQKMARFMMEDCSVTEAGGALKIAYAEVDRRYVINANASAGAVLMHIGRLLDRQDMQVFAQKLMHFVVSEQSADGGWNYFAKGTVTEKENFIDCFHSAFVLEDLLDYLLATDDEQIANTFGKGLDWFCRTFIAENGKVTHFAKTHLPFAVLQDTRSAAAAISLCAKASIKKPELLKTAHLIFERITADMYDHTGGYHYHRRYAFGTPTLHYARWSSAPLIASLAEVINAESRSDQCAE